MSVPAYQARRATLDDLEALRALWEAASLPAGDLEKRLTDFQIVQSPDGQVVGCLGLQIDGRQGFVYGEVCPAGAPVDLLRRDLWERVRNVARNRQLLRLWSRQSGEFWDAQGFGPPSEALALKRPAAFQFGAGPWCVLALRDETEAALSAEKEFELFVQGEKDSSARALRQAQVLKYLAWIILAATLGVLLYLGGHVLAQLGKIRR